MIDNSLIVRLRKRGLLEPTARGEEGIRVALHYTEDPPLGTEEQQTRFLRAYFARLAKRLERDGVEVETKTLSVYGQNMEAIVPISRFTEVERKLMQEHVEVVPNYPRHAAL
jgi:hypothetical protein